MPIARRAGAPAPPPRGPRIAAVTVLLAAAVALATIVALGASVGGERLASGLRHGRAADPPAASSAGALTATLPFPPDRFDRRPRTGEVPSLYDDGLACSTGCRPYGAEPGWPLKPFHRQHPIRAGLNELRPGSLHVGIDIQAPDGTPVYAVQPGLADVLTATGPNARVQVGNYIYWHIAPAVRTGEPVVPFETVLGTVLTGYGHLAFSEVDARDQYVNPLRPGGSVLVPYADRAPPVIGAPAVAAGGQVIVPAYSPQSFVRRTTYLTPVLAPAALAYRLYDLQGTPLTPLEWAFRGTHLLPWALRSLIYAPGARAPGFTCFATRSVCVPHWVYRLAGGMAPPLPTALAPGRYRLSIYAWDWADNQTARDVMLTMTPAGWQPLGRFPKLLFQIPGYYTESELLPPARPLLPTGPPLADGESHRPYESRGARTSGYTAVAAQRAGT